MDLSIIKDIAHEKNIFIRRIAEKMEMSDTNLHKCIKSNKMSAENIEKVAKILNVPIEVFFDKSVHRPATDSHAAIANGQGSSAEANDYRGAIINAAEQEIENLKNQIQLLTDKTKLQAELIAEKDRAITLLKESQKS